MCRYTHLITSAVFLVSHPPSALLALALLCRLVASTSHASHRLDTDTCGFWTIERSEWWDEYGRRQ